MAARLPRIAALQMAVSHDRYPNHATTGAHRGSDRAVDQGNQERTDTMDAPMTPVIEKFETRNLGPKDWGIEKLVAHTAHYTGKVLTMRAGTSGPFQYHKEKNETFYLFSG